MNVLSESQQRKFMKTLTGSSISTRFRGGEYRAGLASDKVFISYENGAHGFIIGSGVSQEDAVNDLWKGLTNLTGEQMYITVVSTKGKEKHFLWDEIIWQEVPA